MRPIESSTGICKYNPFKLKDTKLNLTPWATGILRQTPMLMLVSIYKLKRRPMQIEEAISARTYPILDYVAVTNGKLRPSLPFVPATFPAVLILRCCCGYCSAFGGSSPISTSSSLVICVEGASSDS
jgi:hypothetical protein